MNDQMNTMAPMMKDMMGNNSNMMGPGMMGQGTNQGISSHDNGQTK